MANVHTLTATLEARTRDFQQQIQAAEKRLSSLEKASGGASAGIDRMSSVMRTVGVGALVAYGKQLFDLGVKTQAWGRRYNTVFQGVTTTMDRWIKEQGDSFGVAEEHLQGMAAAVGDLLVPMGFARSEAASMTQQVLTLSNALSLWTGGTMGAEEAQNAITRAILGEREALISLGVKISEADLEARLAAKGQKHLTGELLAQARAAATLELITERSADALTAYESGGDDAAMAMRRFEAAMEDLQIQASEAIVELAPLLGIVAEIAGFAGETIDIVVNLIPGGDTGQTVALLSLAGFLSRNKLKAGAALAARHPAVTAALAGYVGFKGLLGFAGSMSGTGPPPAISRRPMTANTPAQQFYDEQQMLAEAQFSLTRRFAGQSAFVRSAGGIDPDAYADVVRRIRAGFVEPMKKIPAEVIGAFEPLPKAIDISVSELLSVFEKHLSGMASWESNLDRLVTLGLDSVAQEFSAAGPEYAALLEELLSDPLLTELEKMEADIDRFNASAKLSAGLGVSFAEAGVDWSILADLRSELGITADAWIRYWAAAANVGASGPVIGTPGGPRSGFVGHSGGIVPGPTGMAVPILAMAGERVVPTGVSAGGGGGGGGVVNVYVAGSVVSERQLVDQIRAALRNDRIRGGSLEL